MAYDYSLIGALAYPSAAACRDALATARELLEHEETDFAEVVSAYWSTWFRAEGAMLHVSVVVSGPGDWWFALEGLIEELADDATAGFVDARHESAPGLVTRYGAGGDEDELSD